MPIYKPLLLLFYFLSDEVLGLPLAFGSGRAVPQLAIRSALRRLRRLGLAFGHCYPSLSRRLRRL